MSGEESLRVGCVGVGGAGRRLAEQFHEHPGATLLALADPAEEQRRDAGGALDVDPAMQFAAASALVDETELDAVSIASPPGLHYDQVITALDRGCHVLCEKPMVTDLEDAKALSDHVEASDRRVMVGYQRHLNPAYRYARERWQEGPDPHFITGELAQDWRHHFASGEGWRMDPELGGGGHVFSVGTHVLDAILWTSGLTPAQVTARISFADDDGRIDDQSSITIEFAEGGLAQLADTGRASATREHLHAWDDTGAVYLDGEGWDQRRLSLVDADGETRRPDLDYAGTPTVVEAFLSAIHQDREPPATVRDGLRVTAVLEAAYRSAETDAPATVRI
jgi:predicted dehydrogenase